LRDFASGHFLLIDRNCLIPKGHSANRSLSAIEPVSATAKRKLENSEQRPVPEIYPARLDPHFAEGGAIDGVRNETLAQHLVEHAGSYDAVCAFQVLEHVKAPATLFAQMVQAVKLGGLIFVGVPHTATTKRSSVFPTTPWRYTTSAIPRSTKFGLSPLVT
jgi:SAM-dependent methyltransferase